jgi:hypothetical protein
MHSGTGEQRSDSVPPTLHILEAAGERCPSFIDGDDVTLNETACAAEIEHLPQRRDHRSGKIEAPATWGSIGLNV